MSPKFTAKELARKELPVRMSKLPMNNAPWMRPVMSGNPLEIALASLPLYGGTTPESSTTTATTETPSATTESSAQSGNDTSTAAEGSGSETSVTMSPEQIADLVKQVADLSTTNKTLQGKVSEQEKAKQDADRAKMGREEALQADLEDREQTIIKMDQALRNQALLNAINGYTDIQWHDPKFVMGKLDSTISESMEVDLENGTVTVSGIENDLKRVAKEYDWAVKKTAAPSSNGNSAGGAKPVTRGSGAPPAPPNGGSSKETKRSNLIDKYPVLRAGRSGIG